MPLFFLHAELIRHLTVLAIVCALAAPSTRSRRFCAALSKISENGHRRLGAFAFVAAASKSGAG